jgi:hypothetical protein
VSAPNWTSNLFPDGVWPTELKELLQRTTRTSPVGRIDSIWGEGSTWYFWDETWADACGPWPTEAEAKTALSAYAETL